MKGKLNNYLLKLSSLVLAFILVFPTEIFAIAMDDKASTYNASTSIMGLATQTQNPEENSTESTEEKQTLIKSEISTDETDEYLIEKLATLSKTTGQIDYKILVKSKKSDDKDKNQTAIFAITQNTDLKDLRVEKVQELSADGTEKDAEYTQNTASLFTPQDNQRTFGITTTSAENAMVYYLSAKLSEEALADIDKKSPNMDLEFAIKKLENIYQSRYALEIAKPQENDIIIDNNGDLKNQEESLKEITDNTHQYKAIYKEESQGLFANTPAHITWTDYINNKDDKEFTYDINLDQNQDTSESQINIQYYEASEKGYILNESFTKTIPFTNSLKLTIPQGYIAQVELTTRPKENVKVYTFNGAKVANPTYKEEKTPAKEESKKEDDTDPLPAEIETEKQSTEESKDTSEEKIIPIDPETNEAVIDHSLVKEDTKEESEPAKEETSAINLNRDSVISKFNNEQKLHPSTEVTINNITTLLQSHNNNQIDYDQFVNELKSQTTNLSKEDFREVITGLIAGLNEENYKVANLDTDALVTKLYPENVSNNDETSKMDGQSADQQTNPITDTDTLPINEDSTDTESSKENNYSGDPIKEKAVDSFDQNLKQLSSEAKKPQVDDRDILGNISEGLKGIFGQSSVQKADAELKAALDEGKSLEEIQALLLDLGEKYQLNRKDEAKLMADNEESIKALIARDADENFRPLVLQAVKKSPLETNKFTIRTRFDTSTANGPIKAGQYFNVHLDKALTVKEGTKLEPIRYNGEIIASPEYDQDSNTIKYTITKEIPNNIQVPLNIDVDYNTSEITDSSFDDNGLMTITNSVSGLGVKDPKSLLPEQIDRNGNPAGSIIELGRDDVIKIIEPDDSNYKVDTDAYAIPVIKDGKLDGYNWTIKVSSDTDLNELGLKVNFTEVVGSGLGEFQKSNVKLGDNQIKGAFGIHDSKHHAPDAGIKEITYNFYTPVQGMQEKYMMDISIILTAKNKVGAKRFVMDGWPADKVKEATPIRSGMNNRTTVLGEFTSETAARWTVTDGVSTGDVNKDKNISTSLPLETRSLGGNQTISSSKMAVYGLNDQGQMVAIKKETDLNKTIPAKGKNPGTNQPVGTIAVYGYDTSFNTDEKNPLSLAGVEISKCQDIYVDQNWNLDQDLKMPAQTLKAVDSETNAVLGTTGENGVPEQSVQQGAAATRSITIPNVKVWNIQSERKFTKTQPKIEQTFPTDKTYNGQTISYYENHNYYDPNTKGYNIHNRGTVEEVPKMANFTIVKVDKENPEKKLAGARFKLLNGPEVVTDANGEAVFNNIKPGTYTIFETKSPNGYKVNQEYPTINIDNEGRLSLEGGSASISVGANPTKTVAHGGYPDYMNAMQYATKDANGNVTTYIFLKANEAQRGGSTNKDTRLNLRMDNGSISKVEVFDVYPSSQRNPLKTAMSQQTADNMVSQLGASVLNSPHGYPIKGEANVTDSFTNKTGYQVYLPKERFANDWGFLVKVTGTGDSLSYDWLTNNNTRYEAKLQDQKIVPSTSNDTDKATKITITNEAFETRPVEVTKLDRENNAIKGATFVIKDENGDVISTITSGKDGKVSFGNMPGGKYIIEETQAPEGYVKSNVVFDVTVDGTSQATYKPRFKNGSGYPVKGQDYLIRDIEQGQDEYRAEVKSVEQRLYVNEKENGSIGKRQGIWEAYFLESLSYTAKINLKNSAPGSRFSIQFDPNLDFTQYFSEFPKIMKDGKEIADPYFDYTTNKLTYVFNKNSEGGVATANIKLVGIIPSKYFAQNDGTYNFTVTVAPGQDGLNNQTITQPITADYNLYYYDPKDSKPSQAYYFRDVYKADDGNWYVTALAYYNPDYVRNGSNDVLNFNWKAVKHYKAGNYVKWTGDGTTPPYNLTDVKIYRTAPDMGIIKLPELQTQKKVNYNMPLSFGVRPEQDPSTYHLIYSRAIDPNRKIVDDRNGDVVLNYDPSKLNTWGTLEDKGPLNIKMPSVNNRNKDGYIIEQTFKIDDINKFNNTWRAFNMANGSFNSAFVSKANANIAIADQTGGEIPKYYSQEVALFNEKYEPGSFKILKQDETNNKALSNATFSLTDEDNNVIYRSSGADGIVSFENLKPGSYTLKEEIPPKDFVKTDRRWDVNVSIDGNVTITEIGLNASGETLYGKDIKIPVGNKPTATEFRVYKKDADNKPLEGAEFELTKQGETTAFATGTSGNDGVVTFSKDLTKGTYLLEETNAPKGYQKLNQKWVVEVDDSNNVKIYTYNEKKQDDPSGETQQFENSLLTQDGVNWVNVSQRPTGRFISGDNRQTGYADKSQTPYKLGTRILGINKTDKYAIQRYVINPEGKDIDIKNALIHREKLWDENMPWYKGDEAINIYTLDKPVTTNVEDIRLYSYNYTDITDKVEKSPLAHSYSDRLQLVFKKENLTDASGNSLIKGKPIIVDVKIPYTNEYGGVGTGMDLNTSVGSSWKSDYYELVSDIAVGDSIKKDNITDDIKGSYLSDDYLDVANEKKRYEFAIDKVNEEKNTDGDYDAVTGATFKLVGPKPSKETRWTKSDKDGKVSFKDLVPGTYNLVETGPAQGYEQAKTDWKVSIENDGKIYISDNNTNENTEESTSEEKTAKLLVDGKEATTPKVEIGGESAKPVQITNKKDGITPKIIKTDSYGNKLKGAKFIIKKMTDDKYETVDEKFPTLKGTSDKDGNVTFKDENKENKNVVKLEKGYYVLTEEKSPDGYKRITAPWKMEVKDDGGRMYSVYKGPTDTPSSFIDNNKKANAKTYNSYGDIKVKSRLTYINPESKTFVQRIYIDTRNYTGGDYLNVQISPKYKREEIDRPGLPPVTIKEGVKTAYRTTYQLVNPEENADIKARDYDKILRTYDLSDPNMSMVNTARWRPFDWGFDEDQLNIGKGVYIVEVEGYYDDTIIDGRATNEVYVDKNYNFTDAQGNPSKEPVKKAPYKKTDAEMNSKDYGKIDLHVDFYKGKREFKQLVYSQKSKSVYFDTIIGDTGKNTAAYQGGAEALRKYLEATYGKVKADAWANDKPNGQKYANFISKKVNIGKDPYITGKVDPSVITEPYHHADTSVDLNPIYSSKVENEVPKDGLVIENEKEKYNITFSKHGRDNPDDAADSQVVTENRLEGAVFKLQKLIGGNYEDVKGSTVASAFNGYFGFRNLEPGRYRLMEVQAPKGYRPINEPLLSFTVETIRTDSGKIVDPETGKIIDIKTINVKFPEDTKAQALPSLYMTDPKDSTKKTQIKNVDSKEINMETIIYKSADATSGKPLKELTLVVSDGNEYALLQTKIISDSSGFVSLEYEGANGVYQYVPEKTTSVKDGKLVDFVTSATAKNMGKIINEKPGKGSITINKKDGEGKALEGASFKLTRLSRKKTEGETEQVDGIYNATSDANGKVEFKDLPIGNYELVETKAVDGYQNKGQIWHFTVGGEGLDPYSGPIARTGVDLTDHITLKDSNMSIIRPDNDPYKQTKNTIWPNSAQLFRFENDFELTNGKIIRPGDYFQVKLSDYMDLYGIYNKDLVSGLDIFADGVGTIAKAEYDSTNGIITYTFTEYARTYELTDFNTSIVGLINRFKFTTSQNDVPVGFKMYGDNTDSTFKNVNVRFDLGTHFAEAYGTRPNLSSKITYFDIKTGEFEHIFYLNRDQNLIEDGRFTYIPDKGVENLRLQVFRVNDNLLNHYNNNWQNNMNKILPPSYAVNVNQFVNNGYIYLLNNNTYYGNVSKANPAVYTFPNGFLQPEDTYIIRVTGSIKDKTDTADYEAQGKIDRYNYYNQPYMGAERHDYVYGLLNENNAEAKLEITATNPKNEISFKKTDAEGKVLKGAKFALVKQDGENWTEVEGTEKTTKEDGLVKYEKLAPGKYALIEKQAPTGYNKIEGHIEEFTVDKDGIITKEVTRPKGSDNPVGSGSTTTPVNRVIEAAKDVVNNAVEAVTGEETETVKEPIGSNPINVVNYKNIEFVKVDGDDNTKKLAGAVFEVHYKEKEDGDYAALTKKETVDGKEVENPITVTSDKDGKFKLPISKDGYYALVETKAPQGYSKFPGKIKEFKLESGSVSVLEKDPLKASLTRGKKGQIVSQVLSVDKNTFTQRIVINPNHERLTGINESSYLRILENGWSITPKVNNTTDGGKIKVAILKKDPGKEDKKSIADLTKDDYKTYNPVSYNTAGNNTGSRYSLKELLGKASEKSDISTTDTIVVEYTGTLAKDTTKVDQKAELIIDNTILDTADYSLDIDVLSSTDPIYVDVDKSNITPIEVENKKSTFPLTGGNGVFIGFAIIGTAVMLASIAYFAIYQNDKNRRRSDRYGR
ncbi:SpaA isopeptide-forming pilin-related protein [Anaerococcus sp. ENR0831]|uniref:SpaA isopeptide-forming pilin-related protein n=1 Tax=Anaerococcus martiniensis TaxID=3115615 RepID=A0ABW9M8M8_9FIRM